MLLNFFSLCCCCCCYMSNADSLHYKTKKCTAYTALENERLREETNAYERKKKRTNERNKETQKAKGKRMKGSLEYERSICNKFFSSFTLRYVVVIIVVWIIFYNFCSFLCIFVKLLRRHDKKKNCKITTTVITKIIKKTKEMKWKVLFGILKVHYRTPHSHETAMKC